MAYATQADIEATYPNLLGRIAYDRTAQAIETAVVEAVLDHASAVIDMWLSQRYTLPLSPIPPIVTGFAVDIAIYRICLTRDKLTPEMRQRYEDVIDSLKSIAAGKAGVGNATFDTSSGLPNPTGGQDANNQRAQLCIMRRAG